MSIQSRNTVQIVVLVVALVLGYLVGGWAGLGIGFALAVVGIFVWVSLLMKRSNGKPNPDRAARR